MQENQSSTAPKPVARRVTLAVSVAAVAAVGLTTLGATANASTAAPGAKAAALARPAAASATVTPQVARASHYWTKAKLLAAKDADTVVVSKSKAATFTRDTAPTRGKPGRVAGASAPAGVRQQAIVTPHNVSAAADWWGSLSSAPATTTGRVFFSKYTASGAYAGDWSCSGSIVNSEGKDMVVTAGHCVHGGSGYQYHRNWIFVPGYRYGSAPQGIWYAKRLQTLTGWSDSSDTRYDMGIGLVWWDGSGNQITNRFGGQGIAWNYSSGYFTYDLGYPADPPFNGTTLKVCTDDTFSDPWSFFSNIGIDCNMTGGASGGPWLRWFNGAWGWVNGVNSYKWGWLPNNVYSPYFGDGAANLYNANRYL